MNFPVSYAAVTQVVNRMADDVAGLNATYNNLISGYGLTTELAIVFDPSNQKSKNFALANVSDQDWQKSGAFNYPLVSIFSEGMVNENYQKFQMFAGNVKVGMNVFLSWNTTRLRLDQFEPTAWAMEEAVITIMNRARNADPGDQEWNNNGAIVAYNGEFSLLKSKVERGDSFWRQLLAFKFDFLVIQGGPS